MGRSKAGKAWWMKLTPEKRAEMKQRHMSGGGGGGGGGRVVVVLAGHHYQEDRACVPCGTDGSVGCIAEDRRV